MRHSAAAHSLPTPTVPGASRTDWQTLNKLLPYLWRYRWRVGLALGFLLLAKVANVGVGTTTTCSRAERIEVITALIPPTSIITTGNTATTFEPAARILTEWAYWSALMAFRGATTSIRHGG